MKSKSQIILCCFLVFGIPISLFSHGDLHERIKEVTKEIKANPDSTALYMKRGELYLQHEEYRKALKDFKTCEKREFSSIILSYNFAAAHFAREEYTKAVGRLEYVIDSDSSFVRAYRMQGQTYLIMGMYDKAAVAFESVIRRTDLRIPENYFEASIAWEKTNTDDGHCKSLDLINEGIDDLGELFTFYQRLVELNVKYGDVMPGIEYQTKIIEQSQRKERPLYERAVLYLKIGYKEDAKKDLEEAKSLISKLKDRLKNLPSTQDLSESIESTLKKLS
jgi:tetratricopeptide (TPR) repeat protein